MVKDTADQSHDFTLKEQIDELNKAIRALNTETRRYSPKFNLDITWCRSAACRKNRYCIKYKLFKDGIHPDELLAKVWLRNLIAVIIKDCK